MGMGHEHHLSLPKTQFCTVASALCEAHTAHLACSCGLLAYFKLIIKENCMVCCSSDNVNVVESKVCGGGRGHCRHVWLHTYDGALSCGQPLWHRMVMHMVTL